MLKVTVVGDRELIQKFSNMPPRVHNALEARIRTLAEKLVRHIKMDKLSGQVLHVRTNRLRSSIAPEFDIKRNSIYAIVGTNVEYAGIHEYGFSGAMTVKAHLRKLARTSKDGKTHASVRAHSRNVNLPERSFLRSALADMSDEIREGIAETAAQAVKDAKENG